eukprot:TRINITY_DN121887_c0_g1_i1.p1 TRINITY_DN121887_c0_g1~~TRINITY_DN121887_c0_g1_i1.p1  ORF type:complete len:336 (-),score=84.33 TRINITY_DN121887_c0_g1_i1:78-1085(-)
MVLSAAMARCRGPASLHRAAMRSTAACLRPSLIAAQRGLSSEAAPAKPALGPDSVGKGAVGCLKGVPDVAHFHARPRKTDKTFNEKLDLGHLFTNPVYTEEERTAVEVTHSKPSDLTEKMAYGAVTLLRLGADLFSGYIFKSSIKGGMKEKDWLKRIVFLETVAGVPGMVGGMVRHLHSLRLMQRDHGWIHALLSEAENERMHLLIALKLYRPGKIFRACVLVGQGVFFNFFFLSYLISPRFCHRFVGYLEEEAVKTYTHLLEEIDNDMLPLFANTPAPNFARVYYQLPADAKLPAVFACMRKDEAHHRDANHTFSRLRHDEPNPMVEHLRQYHQ